MPPPANPPAAVVWRPGAGRAASSELARFSAAHRPGADHTSLHAWSVAAPDAFWRAVWDFTGLIGAPGDAPCVAGLPGTGVFLPEARLSYAANLLQGDPGAPALVAVAEDGTREDWDRGRLRAEVGAFTAALAGAGIGRGDRVAGVLANTPRALVAMLATNSLGAVWASCSPDFGPTATLDRLAQVGPKALVAASGYRYGGKDFDCRANLATVAAGCGAATVVVDGEVPADLDGAVGWADFTAPHAGTAPAFTPQAFTDPGFILFSSGTTGKPKCIVHSAAGILLKVVSELALHVDVRPGDRVFFFTTCGWMMWNWLVTALAVKATVVLYDGSPVHPGVGRLARLAGDERVTHFGASAKFFDLCRKRAIRPAGAGDWPLRTVMSTGSPLAPANFDYLLASWGADTHVASITGGTDICACFLSGAPTLPVRRGELQVACLGCDMAVFDPDGQPVTGTFGELVCRNAIPSMPLGFWDDADGSRYRAAYLEHYPGVWRHGDWARVGEDGGWVVSGRSDATLNPQGVRIGTAEIYRQVEGLAEVAEAVAVGQEWDGDQRVVLFVVLAPATTLDAALIDRIRTAIRTGASPRHVPAKVIAVTDIPRTRSGKIAELAIQATIHGRDLGNREALANPEALRQYAELAELAG